MTLPLSTTDLERRVFAAEWQQLLDLDPPDDDRLAAHLAAAQALAAAMLGRGERALQRAEQALAAARDRHDAAAARALCARVEAYLQLGRLGAADDDARQAYEALEPAAADWRALLEVRLGLIAAHHGQEEGLEQGLHGVDALEAAGHALASRCLRELADAQGPQRHEEAMSLWERATRLGPPEDQARAHLALCRAHLQARRLSLVSHHLAEAREVLPTMADPGLTAELAEAEARLSEARGQLPEALRHAERAVDAANLAGRPTSARRLHARLLAAAGQVADAQTVARRLGDEPHDTLLRAILQAAHAPDQARAPLARALRMVRTRPVRDAALAGLVEQLRTTLPEGLAVAAGSIAHRLDADGEHAPIEQPTAGPWSVEGDTARHLATGEGGRWVLRTDGHPDALESHALDARWHQLMQLWHPGIAGLLDHGRLTPDEASRLGARRGDRWAVTQEEPTMRLSALAGRMRWAEVAFVLQQLLAALAHAHAHGVLHLGITAEKVAVASAGDQHRAVLGGWCSAPPEVPLSPEQLDEAPMMEPSTDLFAVGLLAWQLVTGRTPWSLRDRGSLPDSFRRGPPPLLPASPVPAGFEGWLQRLLSPEKERRFPLAAEAAAALERLGDPDAGATPVPVGRRTHGPRRSRPSSEPAPLVPRTWPTPPPALPVPAARRYLPAPRLVGRSAEQDLLWQALADTVGTHRPHLVVVEGPAGSGRTALVRWLAQAAQAVGAARSVMVSDAPGEHLRHRLVAHLDAEGVRPSDLPAHLEARLPALDAAQRHALVELLRGVHHPTQPLAVATAWRAQVPARPLVVGLARRTASEPLTVPLARELLRRDGAVLVILEALPDEPGLEALQQLPTARRVVLPGGVDPSILSSWTDDEPADALRSQPDLARARQRLEHAHDTGCSPDVDQRWATRLRDATAARPAVLVDALAAALLPEGSCETHRWEAACRQLGLSSHEVLPLVDAGVLVPSSRGWRVAHPELLDALAAALRASPGRQLVARVARSLGQGRPPEHLAQLALLTGQPDAALGPLYQAASAAVHAGDADRADALMKAYDQALRTLAAPPSDRRWLASHLLRSHGLLARGDAEGARLAAEQALSLVPTASEDRARALDALGAAADRCGDLPTARQAWSDAAKQWAGARQDARARASALAHVHALRRRGRVAEALRALRELSDHPQVTLAHGLVLASRGADAQAREVLSSVAAHLEGEDRARLHLCLARLAARSDALDDARAHLARARRRVEDRPDLLRTHLALLEAYVAARDGQLVAASRLAHKAVEQGREPGLAAWGLALRLLYGPSQSTEALAALESALRRGGRCDPDLAWALDRAADEATDALTVARLARCSATVWRTLWAHARDPR